MLYPITRPLAKIALAVFFRKLYLSGLENVDWEKPVILAANHPTAFIEPCILACWLPKPLHFMVRGDMFLKPVSNFLLRDLNMIPFFRMEDAGVAGVKGNFRSVEEAAAVLRAHRPVLILAEGHTVHEKRLRPLRKGTARIALGTQDQFPDLDIQLVPVGVNYTYADRFRSEAMIHFGKPIPVRAYVQAYRENSAAAFRDITEALREGLESHVVIIGERGDEKWADLLLEIYRNNQPEPFGPQTVYDGARLEAEKRITALVNDLELEEKAAWKGKAEQYARELARHKASDRSVARGEGFPLGTFASVTLGAPLYAVSLLFHALPLWTAYRVGYGRGVPRYEFKASVALATGIGAYLVWALVLFFAGAALCGWLWGMGLVVVGLGLFGWFGLWYGNQWESFRAYRRLPAGARAELEGMRDELAAFFGLGG
jgi:glycerol-3-phosphate O-acyltransferase / dihydroxyacetone phosphate acyltransferase